MLSQNDPHRRDLRQIHAIREVPLILDVCAKATGMGFTAIARVTEDRWITCASLDHLNFGLLPGDELEVSSTICHEVRASDQLVVIDDVDASDTYRDHHTPARYGFKSYISVPITRTDGSFWGTLCAIHPEPRALGPDIVAMFQLFTQLIALELDVLDELEGSRRALATERDTARLREEFIAVVGHDLRNPVAAISAGLRLLGREALSERGAMLLAEMQRSTLRMEMILTNLLDFARGRLGTGIELQAPAPIPLEPVIREIVQETELVSEQRIELQLDLPRPIRCDPQRMGQLLSNLLGNAVTHGAKGEPIRVEATDRDGILRLAVTNHGPPIPEEVRPSLFLPFSRGGESPSLHGLGLGLYIASEIARAHGGQLEVESTDTATTFTLTMPARHG